MSKINLNPVFFILTYLIAGFPILPYAIRSIVTILILVFTVLSYFYDSQSKKTSNIKILIITISPFVFLAISVLYSTNLEVALDDLTQMVSFLVFPIVFFNNSWRIKDKHIKIIQIIFCASITALVIYQAVNSLINLDFLLMEPTRVELKSNGLLNAHSVSVDELKTIKIRRFRKFNSEAVDTHPTYQALWIVFSLFLIAKLNFKKSIKFKVLAVIVFIALFFWLILISSRMPIISGLIGLFVVIFLTSLSFKKRVAILILFCSIFTMSYFFVNTIKVRVDEVFVTGFTIPKKEDKVRKFNSTNVRNGIHYCSLKLAKDNFLYGSGIGDIQELLTGCLINEVNPKIYSWRNFNTHNQYLFFLISTGVFGLLCFLISLFIPFKIAFNNQDLVYIYFLIIVSSVFLTENLLARNDGILFYSFFNALFLFAERKLKDLEVK